LSVVNCSLDLSPSSDMECKRSSLGDGLGRAWFDMSSVATENGPVHLPDSGMAHEGPCLRRA